MKALLLTEYRRLEVVEEPDPLPGPDDLLVRVRACGICGSDIHGFDGSSGRRIPPIIMGHEAAGEVAAVGTNVDDFRVGDRVTFDSTIYCGRCFFCRRGDTNLCDARRVLGVSCGEYRQNGAFAEFVAVPQRICYPLPEAVPFEHAALIEAVAVAVHAVRRAPVRLGDTGVVVGSGMIGLLVIQALRLAGCVRTIAIDLDRDRLAAAKGLGATETLDPSEVDVAEQVRRLTSNRGADVVMEVVGASSTIPTAIQCCRKGGAVTLVGNLSPEAAMPLQSIVTREISLFGSCASSGEYPSCIQMMEQGRIDVRPLITATAPLDEGPAWFDRLYHRQPGAMKVVLQPSR